MTQHQVKVKEYLSQAVNIDRRIEAKMGQLSELRALATKVTGTFSDMPKAQGSDGSRMENVVCRIVELEDDIRQDLSKLLETKGAIMRTIKTVDNYKLQAVLELRYLSGKSWEAIAHDMDCSIDNLYKLHKKALEKVKIFY